MENAPHSLPNLSFFSDSDVIFTSHKSVYDDVFSGPPKFGIPTLAPRLEDYSEIFGGFHSSQSLSIPLLHLPLIGDDSDFRLDVRSPGFDYTEVFGDIEGLPFTASFQDTFGQSGGGYDSSDEQWSPAQSESPSDELDPLAGSDKNSRLSDGEVYLSLGSINQFNQSYNMSGQRNMKIVSNASNHVTNVTAAPPCIFSQGTSTVSWHGEHNNCPKHVTDDTDHSEEFDESFIETKHKKNSLLDPLHGGYDAHVNDFNPSVKQGNSPIDKPFMTVSEISLRTKPSQLPPPSRPPPAFVNLKDSFGRVVYDSAPILFDMKGGDTISEGRTNTDENVKVKHESDKESIERRDLCNLNGVQLSSSEDDIIFGLNGKETTFSAPVIEDGIESRKSMEEASVSWEQHCSNITHNSAEATECWEATEYIEVIDNKIHGQAFNMVEDCDTSIQHVTQDNYRHQRTTAHEEFNQNESRKAHGKNLPVRIPHPRWDEEKNPPEMREEHCDGDVKRQEGNQKTSSNDQILRKLGGMDDFSKTAENFQQFGESENLRLDQYEILEGRPKTMDNVGQVEGKLKLKVFPTRMHIEEKFIDAQVTEHSTEKYEQNKLRVEHQRRFKDDGEETSGSVIRRAETGDIEKQYSGASEKDNKLKKTSEMKESGLIVEEDKNDGESANNSYGVEEHNESLMEAGKQQLNKLAHGEAVLHAENDEEHKLVHEREVIKGRSEGTSQTEYNGLRYRIVQNKAGNEEEDFETEGSLNMSTDTCIQAKMSGYAEEIEAFERNGYEREFKMDLKDHALAVADRSTISDGGCKLDEVIASKFSVKHDTTQIPELNQTAVCEGHTKLKTESNGIVYDTEAASVKSTSDDRCGKIYRTQFISKKEDVRDPFTRFQKIRKPPVYSSKVEDGPPVFEHSDNALYSIRTAKSQRVETKNKNMKESISTKASEGRERIKRETELENDHMRKVEEEREREREREKDRMAVDKVALEAHEKSYAQARERAERAAVERSTAEVRLRTMAGTHERLKKSSVEARLKTERAGFERATAEARQLAAEKSSDQKAGTDAHDHAEKYVADRFSASFRSDDIRQSSSSSDRHFQSTLNSKVLRCSYSSALFGNDGESPQRCKARLERYRRTAERAANALAEKNRRDLLAQKEREERNRVAEVLDAEIRRWSSGKEGNLRALLSTLQYILGPDSGWQPVPLTEVITSAAVKKSYRKATLCVHPDKLQQRGATIQQKYICEKVFDLLKEAWSKFNSEEC